MKKHSIIIQDQEKPSSPQGVQSAHFSGARSPHQEYDDGYIDLLDGGEVEGSRSPVEASPHKNAKARLASPLQNAYVQDELERRSNSNDSENFSFNEYHSITNSVGGYRSWKGKARPTIEAPSSDQAFVNSHPYTSHVATLENQGHMLQNDYFSE